MSWRLAALLGVREREEARRTAALWDAARREAEALDTLASLRAATARPLLGGTGGTPVHALARASRFARAAAVEARHAALAAARAAAEVEVRRVEVAAAARERAALERLRARWESARRRERERREEDARDDLVAGRAGRGR